MRSKLSVFGIVLLVTIVVLGGVTGCERSAEKRSPEATTPAGTVEPGASTTGGEEGSPAPGQTVVSVAGDDSSSQPSAEPGITEVAPETGGGETPAAPTATGTSGTGSEPVATEQPSSSGTTGGTSGSSTGSATGCRITHIVKAGEWIWQLARDYGVSPYDILSANNLTINTGRYVYPGQKLCIP